MAAPTAAAPASPPGPSGGAQVRRLSFEDQSGVVPMARDFTRQALYDWGWLLTATADRRAAAEDVLLVVSELVTNACLHAEGPDLLTITSDRKVIRLEVTDRGTGQPSPRTPTARAARGPRHVHRPAPVPGLGRARTPDVAGKTVWAELGTPS